MAKFLALIPALVLLLAGCTGADVSAEKAALLAADTAWAAAAESGDVERTVAFWTDDAVMYFPDRPEVTGIQAIRDFMVKNQSVAGFSISWSPSQAVVAQSGEIGYTTGALEVSLPAPDGTMVKRKGNYVRIWRQQADGAWKCPMEISNFRPQ